MPRLIDMLNGGASGDRPVSHHITMLRDTDRQSQPPVPPPNGALPRAMPYITTTNNQPHRSDDLLSLISSHANKSQSDGVPLFQPRPTFRPIQIRNPESIVTAHSQINDTSNPLLGLLNNVPSAHTGVPRFGALAYQTPHSDITVTNQPHRSHGPRHTLFSPANLLPRRVIELRSPPQSNQISSPVTLNPDLLRTNDQANPLASPIDIAPRSEPRQLRFTPGPSGVARKEIVVAKRRLNPLAQVFVPSWLVSPPLFSSMNPYRDSTDTTPATTPGLTPDHSPISFDAPYRSLDHTHKLTTKCVEQVKAELLRPPPVLVPSEYRRRPSPGLFLYGAPPPGLTRHTAYSPHHPAGIAPMPLPPVEISYNPSLGHHRYHSQEMIARLGLKDVEYLNKCAWAWELSADKVRSVTENYLETATRLSVPLT
jgi:hypothetical protein